MEPNTGRRIIHVPRRFALQEWGGTETVVTQLCREQLARGARPEIHTSRALSPLSRESFRGVPVRRYRYSYPFLGLNAEDRRQLDKKGGNLLSLDLLQGLLRTPDVRIFHAHVTKRMGATVWTAARWRRRPCVVTLHGNHFDVPEQEAAEVIAPQQDKLEWGRPFGLLLGSRMLLERADAVLCVGWSEFEAARAALPHDRIHYLPNGVQASHFAITPDRRQRARERLGLRTEHFAFGCVSRMDPQKGQLTLLEAFKEVAASHSQARLILCGPTTSDAYLQRIQKFITDYGLHERVQLLPPVEPDSDAQAELFGALDSFVLASRHEPFGIVVLEAWAAGLPVIAARVGGLQRLIKDGVTGLHVPPGDAVPLAEAMRRLLENRDLGQQLAQAGRQLATAEHSWEAIADQLETIYADCEARYA